MPSLSPSKPCGSGDSTLKFLCLISEQSKSGGGEGIQTSGYAESQFRGGGGGEPSSPSKPSISG
jgi:hypothetical protein